MYYFRKNKENLEKYSISFNKKQVEKLKEDIILNCSFIEHKTCRSDYDPLFLNDKIIKDYFKTKVGEKEYFEETRNVYLHEYNEYESPYLVHLITRLLSGEAKALYEILNYDTSSFISIDEQIRLTNLELSSVDITDIEKKKEKLEQLENLLKSKELNEKQKSVEEYYQKLLKLLKFTLVDTILISDLERVEKFSGIDLDSRQVEDNKGVSKTLKKK